MLKAILCHPQYTILSPGLRRDLSERIGRMSEPMVKGVLAHLSATVRVSREIGQICAGRGRTITSPETAVLRTDSPRVREVLQRIREIKGIVKSVHPEFDELLAFVHDIGKFDPEMKGGPVFDDHSRKGLSILSAVPGDLNFEAEKCRLPKAEIYLLVKMVVRFHDYISLFRTGNYSAKVLLQTMDNAVFGRLSDKPRFKRIFLAALFDVTLSDVGAHGALSLFKIEQFLAIYDKLVILTPAEMSSDDLGDLGAPEWRLNNLIGSQDRNIDEMTDTDPLYYFNLLSSAVSRETLNNLSMVDKLIYFRRFFSALTFGLNPDYRSVSPFGPTFLERLAQTAAENRGDRKFMEVVLRFPEGGTCLDYLARSDVSGGWIEKTFDFTTGSIVGRDVADNFGNTVGRLTIHFK